MIYLVTGPPGSGKSFFCVRKAVDALESGLWLATNVEMHEGWEHELAEANPFRRLLRKRCRSVAAEYARRTWVSHSLEELTNLRLPPCRKCRACKRGLRCMKEGRGIMLLDEAHNWLNARSWDSDESGRGLSKSEAIQNRLRIVRFFSQHRKLGWTVYLVTQDALQVDAQVRRNFEYHVHLRNFRNFRVLGIRLFPMHLFTAVTTWYDSEQTKVGSSVYRLRRKLANLYDTTATSHGLDWDDPNAIWLGQDGHDQLAVRARPVREIRSPTAAEVKSVIGRAAGAVHMSLSCPSCRHRLPFTGSGVVADTEDRPDGVLLLRCPRCRKPARLRAPGSPLILPVGVASDADGSLSVVSVGPQNAESPATPRLSSPGMHRDLDSRDASRSA
jgi:hypothetical protein